MIPFCDGVSDVPHEIFGVVRRVEGFVANPAAVGQLFWMGRYAKEVAKPAPGRILGVCRDRVVVPVVSAATTRALWFWVREGLGWRPGTLVFARR